MQFPNDDDGNVLKQLHEMGFDFCNEIEVEFTVAAPNEEAMASIEKAARNAGYDAEGYFDEGELEVDEEITEENEEFAPSWTVYVTKVVKLEYDQLVAIQKDLDQLSVPFGGKSDGWVVQG